MSTPSNKRIGRPAKFTHDVIADAALKLGLDGITTKGLACYLKTERTTLYRYVKCKDDILELAVSKAVQEIELNFQGECWELYIRDLATKLWELYAKYTGLANVTRSLAQTPIVLINTFATICDQFGRYGFSTESAAIIIDSVIDMTTECASTLQDLTEEKGHMEKRLHSWERASKIQESPHVTLISEIISQDLTLWWRKKIDLLIAGAESYKDR